MSQAFNPDYVSRSKGVKSMSREVGREGIFLCSFVKFHNILQAVTHQCIKG